MYRNTPVRTFTHNLKTEKISSVQVPMKVSERLDSVRHQKENLQKVKTGQKMSYITMQ